MLTHRERTYPTAETLAMFVAQVLNDDSYCQRAVNDRIVRCLQHGLRPPGTSTAAYYEASAHSPISLVEMLFKTVGRRGSENALPEWVDAEADELCPRQIRVRLVISRRRRYQDTIFITTLIDQRLFSANEIVVL